MPTGDWFPQQFALGILNLKQRKSEFEANLAQQRSNTAAENFQKNEQLRLAQEQQDLERKRQQFQFAQSQQAAALDVQRFQSANAHQLRSDQLNYLQAGATQAHYQAGDALAASKLSLDQLKQVQNYNVDLMKLQGQADATAQKADASAANSANVDKQIEAKKEGAFQLSLSRLGTSGAAFIPIEKGADLKGFLDSSASNPDGNHYITIDLPGQGTVVQMVKGKDAAQARLYDAQATSANAQAALSVKRTEAIDARAADTTRRTDLLVGKLNVDTLHAAASAFSSINSQLSAHRKALEDAARSELSQNREPGTAAMDLKSFDANPRLSLDEKSRARYDRLEALVTKSAAAAEKGALASPAFTDPAALEKSGMHEDLFSAPKVSFKNAYAPAPAANQPAAAPAPPAKPKATPEVTTRAGALLQTFNSPTSSPAQKAAALEEFNKIRNTYED